MNSNFMIVVFIGMFTALINEISLSLGLTTQIWEVPEEMTGISDAGFIDGLVSALRWGINNAGSFMQLVTFQADVPTIINTLLVAPFGLGVFYLVYVMIRGGAG